MKFLLVLALVAVFACAVYSAPTDETQNVEPAPEAAKRDKRGFLAAPLAAPLALPAAYSAYSAYPYAAAYHAAPLAYSAPYIASPYASYTYLGQNQNNERNARSKHGSKIIHEAKTDTQHASPQRTIQKAVKQPLKIMTSQSSSKGKA